MIESLAQRKIEQEFYTVIRKCDKDSVSDLLETITNLEYLFGEYVNRATWLADELYSSFRVYAKPMEEGDFKTLVDAFIGEEVTSYELKKARLGGIEKLFYDCIFENSFKDTVNKIISEEKQKQQEQAKIIVDKLNKDFEIVAEEPIKPPQPTKQDTNLSKEAE